MAEQIIATIVKIGTKQPLLSSLSISFPTENITIEVVDNSTIANSVITYNKEKFYASETQADLVTAANDGGGGGVTIYTGDDKLSGDRTVDLNGHILVFQILSGGEFRIQGPVGSPALSVIPYDGITNFERATVAAHDPTGSDNLSQIQVSTTDTTASFSIYADYQDGTKLTEIEANSAAGISTLTYTADTHTFNVGITMSEFAGGGVTGASIDDTGKLIRTP